MESHQHVHDWTTTSWHATSEGAIAYERCRCGRWRVRSGTSVQAEQTLVLTRAAGSD